MIFRSLLFQAEPWSGEVNVRIKRAADGGLRLSRVLDETETTIMIDGISLVANA